MSFRANFVENEQKPLSRGLFALYVSSQLRAQPEIQVGDTEGLTLELTLRGRELVARLGGLYESYRAAPDQLGSIVKAWIQTLNVLPEPAAGLSLEEMGPKVLPLLQPRSMIEGEARGGRAGLVVAPLAGDLVVTYVMDDGRILEYLESTTISNWGTSPAELHARAVENLYVRSEETRYSQQGEGIETILLDEARDGYAATRVLLDGYLEIWSEHLGGEMLLGIPHRELLLAFRSDHPGKAALARRLEAEAQTHPHPLSARLYVWREGGVNEYSD